jgi:hypothetical protein
MTPTQRMTTSGRAWSITSLAPLLLRLNFPDRVVWQQEADLWHTWTNPSVRATRTV